MTIELRVEAAGKQKLFRVSADTEESGAEKLAQYLSGETIHPSWRGVKFSVIGSRHVAEKQAFDVEELDYDARRCLPYFEAVAELDNEHGIRRAGKPELLIIREWGQFYIFANGGRCGYWGNSPQHLYDMQCHDWELVKLDKARSKMEEPFEKKGLPYLDAAKAMDEGHRIRLHSWQPGLSVGKEDLATYFFSMNGSAKSSWGDKDHHISAMGTDDWEIVEMPVRERTDKQVHVEALKREIARAPALIVSDLPRKPEVGAVPEFPVIERLLHDIYMALPSPTKAELEDFDQRIMLMLEVIRKRPTPAFLLVIDEAGIVVAMHLHGQPVGLAQTLKLEAKAEGDVRVRGFLSFVDYPGMPQQLRRVREKLRDLRWMAVEEVQWPSLSPKAARPLPCGCHAIIKKDSDGRPFIASIEHLCQDHLEQPDWYRGFALAKQMTPFLGGTQWKYTEAEIAACKAEYQQHATEWQQIADELTEGGKIASAFDVSEEQRRRRVRRGLPPDLDLRPLGIAPGRGEEIKEEKAVVLVHEGGARGVSVTPFGMQKLRELFARMRTVLQNPGSVSPAEAQELQQLLGCYGEHFKGLDPSP